MGRNHIRAAVLAVAVVVTVWVAGAQASGYSVTGLAATAPVTDVSPSLHWNPLSGAVAYRVVRGGTFLGRVSSTSFTDSTLSTNGVYTYRVRGLRADGTVSDAASVVVIYDKSAPASITTKVGGDRLTNGSPTIIWPTVTDVGPSGIKQYNIRRDGVYIASVSADTLSFKDTKVGPGQYAYTVRAEDRAGNKAVDFSPAAVVTVDRNAPTPPTGLSATVQTASVQLTWQATTDPSGISAYRILRDGQSVGSATTTTFTDAPPTGTHSYAVIAVDGAGNASQPTTAVSATIASSTTTLTSVPTGVSVVTGNDQSTGMKTKWPDAKIISITLHWNQLEPSRGTFDWGNLDTSLRDAAARHYKVIVRILCGYNAPTWIYDDPTNPVTPAYIIPTDTGYGLTHGVNVPVPWDPDLLVLYTEMMTAVANHLKGADGAGGTLADNVEMIPVAMATSFGSEMVENFGSGTWAGTYNGVYKTDWDRGAINRSVWLALAPSGSTDTEKIAAMQDGDTRAWLQSIDAQEQLLQPIGVMSSVAYGYAFTGAGTANTVEATEVPKYKNSLLAMFTSLQPKVYADGTLGPWSAWCPFCDGMLKAVIADGGPVGLQAETGAMNTVAKIEYATNDAIRTYHPRFIETVGTVVDTDYSYFFTDTNSVQSQLAAGG
jgi:hypothetical protein